MSKAGAGKVVTKRTSTVRSVAVTGRSTSQNPSTTAPELAIEMRILLNAFEPWSVTSEPPLLTTLGCPSNVTDSAATPAAVWPAFLVPVTGEGDTVFTDATKAATPYGKKVVGTSDW